MLGDSKLFVKLYVRVKTKCAGGMCDAFLVFIESDLKPCVKSTIIFVYLMSIRIIFIPTRYKFLLESIY